MTTTTALTSQTLARGLVSHQRSLLVWSALLDRAARDLLAVLVTTGMRLLAVDGPLPAPVAGHMVPAELPLWCDDAATDPQRWAVAPGGGPVVSCGQPTSAEWARLQELHRSCGLVPLPRSARSAPEWTHAWLPGRSGAAGHDDVDAAASVQRLVERIGPARAVDLVACVASRPAARRQGGAARCVAAVRNVASGPCVAITQTPSAAGFFQALGWRICGTVWFYQWQ